jgi:hypothetical protein
MCDGSKEYVPTENKGNHARNTLQFAGIAVVTS